jgi:hypothetical protein
MINWRKHREEDSRAAHDQGLPTPPQPPKPWESYGNGSGIGYIYDIGDPTRIEPQYLTAHDYQTIAQQNQQREHDNSTEFQANWPQESPYDQTESGGHHHGYP